MSVSKSNENKIAKLAAAGKTDAEIDAAVYGGEKKWSTREISYAARRDAGLIPSRVGSFERIEDVRAADVRAVLAESPTDLRAYALPIVFGFRPTRANVDRLGGYAVAAKRPGRLASGAYRKARA